MFKVVEQPKLFCLSYKNLVNLMKDSRLTDEDREALHQYVNVEKGLPPYIIPIGFLKKMNMMGEHKLYLNRRILNLVCRLGFDGWIAMPDTLLQRNMDAKHYQATGEIQYRLNPYNPEIAICKWDRFLEQIKE
jgi:hypothetical protein